MPGTAGESEIVGGAGPHMSKKTRSAGKGLYRDGDKLVIREGARFPHRCAICNKECDGEAIDITFGREQARHIEVAAVQAVARAAGDLMTGTRYTGPVQAEITLCPWHRGRRLRLLGAGLGMTALAVAALAIQYALGVVLVPPGELGFLNISLHNVIAIAAAFVGVVIALTSLDPTKVWFKATKYNDRLVWVAGAGRAFLKELPPVSDRHIDPRSDDRDLTADELIRRARRGRE